MRKLKKGDEVVVITGRSSGKRGAIMEFLGNDLLLVEGVNLAKKHTRGNPQKGTSGGILDKETPIHYSNVALYNAQIGKADKVKIKHLEDGKKVRVFKTTEEVVDI